MKTAIVWLRNILRLHDNPLLNAIHERGDFDHVVPVYIFEPESLDATHSKNRQRFLFQSILELKRNFQKNYKTELMVLSGDVSTVFPKVINALGADPIEIICDYCTTPKRRAEVSEVANLVRGKSNVQLTVVHAVNTLLNIEALTGNPSFTNPKSMKDMQKIFKGAFGVAAGFYKVPEPTEIVPSIPSNTSRAKKITADKKVSKHLKSEKCIKTLIKTYSGKVDYFKGGESEALSRMSKKMSDNPRYVNEFSKPSSVSTNEDGNPYEPTTTGLSAYLATGCLSPRTIWKECVIANLLGAHTKPPVSLMGQLMFREMFYLLSRSVNNWDSDIDNTNCKPIEWDALDKEKIRLWEEGQTGFPLIDAMMRQLEATGWMHHLGRHAVSCFLTRGQLWQNWKHGREVFDKKLIDSDWALNNGNWLWLAGVAPFSMPYFRIYNPCPTPGTSLNVETKEALFIRHWVPELKNFPSKYIFEPHLAPEKVQREHGCVIGIDYPEPMVDRKLSRKTNLAKFKESLGKL